MSVLQPQRRHRYRRADPGLGFVPATARAAGFAAISMAGPEARSRLNLLAGPSVEVGDSIDYVR
jgi:hypothetical protein